MPSISFLTPLDQPTGNRRLLTELRESLTDSAFSRLRMIVAFGKVGPLLRLEELIAKRRSDGLRIEAIFGIDHSGTSAQALSFALDQFDRVYVTQEPNLTFHPKIYVFDGEASARLFVGSNNLTVGGTETNFEAAVRIDLQLPDDAATLREVNRFWRDLGPASCPATKVLTPTLLSELTQNGTVLDETAIKWGTTAGGKIPIPKAAKSGLQVIPPSGLPVKKTRGQKIGGTIQTIPAGVPQSYGAKGLAIQIRPHHNGEIFLSVTAALQNPSFFKWPFTGLTIPKKRGNIAYPQLTPDPRVNISVYGGAVQPLLVLNNYGLNTVYYEKKKEIRITASPLVSVVADYSIMIIQKADDVVGIDYDIVVYTPVSPDYAAWLSACNQKMPSGGKTPRKFGWF